MAFSLYLDSLSNSIMKHNHPTMNQAVAGVYVGTNETETDIVQQVLSNCPAVAEPCHFGFSSWHNFDIMVHRKSARGVLCDFNPNTRAFLNISLMGTACSNRHEYVPIIVNYVKMNISKFSPNVKGDGCIPTDDEVNEELNRKGSWLSTDAGYAHIKKLAAQGKICVITEDIRNENVFGKIAKKLKDNGISIDTLYVSNISQYMVSHEDKNAFENTVKHLYTYETKLIHCGRDLRQTVVCGAFITAQQLTRSILFLGNESAEDQVPVVQDVTDLAEEDVETGASQLAESLKKTTS